MSIINDQPDAQQIREEILAFRTITTLLSELPHREAIQPEDSLKNLPVKNRETIKVCDALAQALVIEHEIIAVTASHRYEMDEKGMLHIVAVSTEDTSKVDTTEVDTAEVDTAEVDMSTLGWGTRMMSNVLNFLCSLNPPMAKPDSEVKLPERKEAEPPAGITKETVLEYMHKLETKWEQPTLSQHLWIITNALAAKSTAHLSLEDRMSHRSVLGQRLMRYISSACYRKISRRFNNKALSQPYYNALLAVNIANLPSISIQPFPQAGDREGLTKMKNDRLFLEDFVLKMEGKNLIKTQIPNLIQKAKELPPQPDAGFQLYTDETRQEFHALLLEILKDFKTSLDDLVNSKSSQTLFQASLGHLYRNGYILLRLSRGSAFQMHIDSISVRLRSVYKLPGALSPSNKDMDPDMNSLRHLILRKRFVGWLRLNVGHFDAAETLARFATSRTFLFKEVSAVFFTTDEPDSTLPSWRSLFENSFLPNSGGRTSDAGTTNDMICQFLDIRINEARLAKEIRDDSSYVKKFLKLGNTTRVRLRLTEMENKLEGWMTNIDAAIGAIDTNVNIDETNRFFRYDKPALVESRAALVITQTTLAALAVKARGNFAQAPELFETWTEQQNEMLTNQEIFLTLDNKKVFTGTLHCEAYLASLLPLHPPSSRPMLAGVNKTLQGGAPKKFLVRGSHDCVTACTLPPWTALPYLKAMNEYWGKILRNDLLQLMAVDSSRRRDRSKTTGSMARASDESIGSASSGGPPSHSNLLDTFPSTPDA
ncbi:hypothetical protein HYPSUDRAFT_58393 [Hypholoma sublateritium FD-334 SS-4]|uniref:Uncharacterized protein n=1 Tax=Hypholoma sublateritium (strain FD-334 SS-4) TaxID=945553 RepID=A0A0D2NHP6_HYPSF|nr:hypothetical protein HYPSUDRAFT_58393 [Hypholoma sublateritium FD-334 SS-4]